VAGQHVQLRIFFAGRVFESHPLTILSAPPSISCLASPDLLLGARVTGDWSRALNLYAETAKEVAVDEKTILNQGAHVQVMMDGPYGGCSVDPGNFESVLLVAGGSGATFTLGLLDDIVGRCIKLGRSGGERTRRIEFAWCVRSFGKYRLSLSLVSVIACLFIMTASIEWFAPMLMDIANTAAGTSLDLHISVFVTCICNPEAIPPIPNSDVTIIRPSIQALLDDLLTPPGSNSSKNASIDVEGGVSEKSSSKSAKLNWVGLGGGVAVCASGPETLTREAHNAVARVGMRRGVELGGIVLHTELFSM
jgi:ferric-chelate reductase